MSAILEQCLTAEQRQECEKNDAAMAADIERDANKGERLARLNDERAMELQLQYMRCIGAL